MADPEKALAALTASQKIIIKKASPKGARILFSIKGMLKIMREDDPFELIEMGYEDLDKLYKKGLLTPVRTKEQGNVLEGEIYELNAFGHQVAALL